MTVYACVGKVGMLYVEKFTEVCYVQYAPVHLAVCIELW